MPFQVNDGLLVKARRVLSSRKRLFWIIGGSAAGKTTICREIARLQRAAVYDMDRQVFESFPGHVDPARHPALQAWFSAPNPFAWMLQLSESDFLSFNQAANCEMLDLLVDDFAANAGEELVLVDGWITNPELLVQVVPVPQVVCLATSLTVSNTIWETDPGRSEMKALVYQLPEPDVSWRTFLRYDELMTQTILAECATAGIPILMREPRTPVQETVDQVLRTFGLSTEVKVV